MFLLCLLSLASYFFPPIYSCPSVCLVVVVVVIVVVVEEVVMIMNKLIVLFLCTLGSLNKNKDIHSSKRKVSWCVCHHLQKILKVCHTAVF